MRSPLQTLSRSDTDTLRHGACPSCNHTRFIIGGLWHHETGAHRRVLCIHCLREFGVCPANGGTAVILHFVMPDRRLADTYNIHTGALPEPSSPAIGPVRQYTPEEAIQTYESIEKSFAATKRGTSEGAL